MPRKPEQTKFVSTPGRFVRTPEYVAWIVRVKETFRRAQAKAAVKVNVSLLSFYWWLGKEIVERKAEQVWGSGVIEQMSLDLRADYPGAGGFSTTNLWYVKKWYLFYSKTPEILHQPGGEMPVTFAAVPWKHHCEIVTHCKTPKTALFYVRETAANGWSRSELGTALAGRLHLRRGKAVTNFGETLPEPRSGLARDMPEKLNFYVTATDHLLRGRDDNPTIGLLLCRSKDDTKVEWAFDGLPKPLGVAAYEGIRIVDALPTDEQLESTLSPAPSPKKPRR